MKDWRSDIQKALELDVESVDCYPLDVYSGTILARQLESEQIPPIGDSETERKMYEEANNIFVNSGYKPACHNRFSRIAEDFEEPCPEILGTGAGFFMGHLGKHYYMDTEAVNKYSDQVKRGLLPIAKLFVSPIEDEMRKMMMRLAIRLPIEKNKFFERFGKLPEDVFPVVINRLKRKGLIEVDDRELKLTKLGDIWRYNVVCEFGP
jgi:oxygen-independent coproporphyrinogen-3 oxidase